MCDNNEEWLAETKAELEEYLSARLPDPEMYIPGPSMLGLAEQRNKILAHLKKQGFEVPGHLVVPPLDELPRTREHPSIHMTLLLMWVGEQGILLPPHLYKTRPPVSHKDFPREITVAIQSYGSFESDGPFEDRIRSGGLKKSVREDFRRAGRCIHAMRLSVMNNVKWKEYNALRRFNRDNRR